MKILDLDNFDEDTLGYTFVSLCRYFRSDIIVPLLRLAPVALLLLISHDLLSFYNPNRWFTGWQQLALSPEPAFWLLLLGVPTLLLAADYCAPIIDRWRTAYEIAGRKELPRVIVERNDFKSSLDWTRRELTKTENQLKAETLTSERTLNRLTSAQMELDKTRIRALRAEAELANTTRLLEETRARLVKAEQLNQSVETRKNEEILSALQEADAQLQDRIKQVGKKVNSNSSASDSSKVDENEKPTSTQSESKKDKDNNSSNKSPDAKAPVQTSFLTTDDATLTRPTSLRQPSNAKDIFL